MNLTIIQNILHGALRPNLTDNLNFRELSNKFSKLPDNLSEIEALFLSNFPAIQFDFENERPNSIDDIFPDHYTQISEDAIYKHLALPIPEPTSPKEKFYKLIAEAEIYRIKIAVIDFAIKKRSDIDTRSTIKETLKQILSYAKNIKADDDVILTTLQTQLVCSYMELASLGSTIMSENEDFLSFEDLMFEVFQHYPKENETSVYQTFVDTLKTNDSIFSTAKPELPSSEEYEKEKIKTNYDVFVENVKDYQFEELEKVKCLNNKQKIKLIRLIVERPVDYSVVMLKHIGYFDQLKNKYNLNKESSFKHIGKALQKSPRIIKGNFNILNPKSNEDPSVYNSQSFTQQVKNDYQNL